MTDRRPKLVVFDLGDTLIRGPAQGPARTIATRLGLDAAERRALHRVLMTGQLASPAALGALLRERYDADVDGWAAELWASQERGAHAIDGAREVIAAWHEAGARLAIASNIWPPFLRGARTVLPDLFAWVPPELQVVSYAHGTMKPESALLATVLARAGVAPEDAVVVGDSYPNDMAPGRALGARTAWILHRPEREAPSVARVADGTLDAPDLALETIAAFRPERWGA